MPKKVIDAIVRTLEKEGMPTMCNGLTIRDCAEKIYAIAQEKKNKKKSVVGGVDDMSRDMNFVGD